MHVGARKRIKLGFHAARVDAGAPKDRKDKKDRPFIFNVIHPEKAAGDFT